MDKPFPWTCGNCGRKTVSPVIGDYNSQFKIEDNLYDVFLSKIEIPTCQNCNTQLIDIKTDNLVVQEAKRLHALKQG